ncbi:MAG: class I SAM-dependent methyltransferase [Candidatus Wallbacteria bacterium]|nr:class I SAM-dependent methyltransferase [Candidatus Wallbacteria bacterium]
MTEDFTTWSRLRDIGRWHVTRFVAKVAESLPAGQRVLDAGAGEAAYRRLFEHCDYTALDLAIGESVWNYSNLDVIARVDGLPLRPEIFDTVVSTQTLEHIEYPRETVAEFFRVLRPGGRLFLTVPMAQEEHQVPYDYFRYTSYGLRSLLSSAGFTETTVSPLGGFFTRWAYELSSFLPAPGAAGASLASKGRRWMAAAAIRCVQRLLLRVDRFDSRRNYPWGWSASALKGSTQVSRTAHDL